MGTSGAPRTTVPFHGFQFDYVNPRDGREIHLHLMAPFGTLEVGCGNGTDLTVGQARAQGVRQVPATRCGPQFYEDWATTITMDQIGENSAPGVRINTAFAAFDPVTTCEVQNGACTMVYNETRFRGGDPFSPSSAYKGVHREMYLGEVNVANAKAPTTVWTDAFGHLVAPNTSNGIAQYLCPLGNLPPDANPLVFGDTRIHDDGTVRAPN
jgi:hypothetical protein